MSSAGRPRDGGGTLEGNWLWVALPVGVLGLIAALWFLVIAPGGGTPPRATATPATTVAPEPTVTLAAIPPPANTEPTAEATEEPTAAPTESGAIAPGARVVVAGTGGAGLRVRQAPGLDTVTLKFVTDGSNLVVVGGPEQAGGLTWWKVDDQAGAVGWVAAQYIQLAP